MEGHDLTSCSDVVYMYCTYYNMFKLEVSMSEVWKDILAYHFHLWSDMWCFCSDFVL